MTGKHVTGPPGQFPAGLLSLLYLFPTWSDVVLWRLSVEFSEVVPVSCCVLGLFRSGVVAVANILDITLAWLVILDCGEFLWTFAKK